MINIIKRIPLLNCKDKLFSCTIFKKCYYNMINTFNSKIFLYDCCLKEKCNVTSCNQYIYITKYESCNKFLALKKEDNNNIYIIDSMYNEIDKVELKITNNYKGAIKAISYDNQKKKIIIAKNDTVYSVSIDGYFIQAEISKYSLNEITINSSKDMILRNINGCCSNQKTISNATKITSVAYICDKLFIAYIKNNSSYISELSNNGNIIDTHYIDDEIEINSIFEVNNNIQLLITKKEKYNYIYITDYCCINYHCLKNYCNICKDKDFICNDFCDCNLCESCNNYNDIIESIALMETSIAHILNAEGEKIQKAVCISDNVCDLIKTNESVYKTINSITFLEQLLVDKLELANREKNECKKK